MGNDRRELIVKEVKGTTGSNNKRAYLSKEDMSKLGVDIGGAVKVTVPRRGYAAFTVGNPDVQEGTEDGKICFEQSSKTGGLKLRDGDIVEVESIEAPEADEVTVKFELGGQASNMMIEGNLGGIFKMMCRSLENKCEDEVISRNSVITSSLSNMVGQNMMGSGMPQVQVKVTVVDFVPSSSDYVTVSPRTSFKPATDRGSSNQPFSVGDIGGFPGKPNESMGVNQQAGKGDFKIEEDVEVNRVPDVGYEDIGGLEDEIERAREMVELPMKYPEIFETAGIEPPKGLILHGPPGTGKTLLAKAISNEIDASFHTISGPEIMSKYYGQSEEKLRELFEEAQEAAPSIIFIDELDAIAPKRKSTDGSMERRVVSQLLSLMDGLETRGDVIVLAATNRIDSVDNALRRGGRFDREIEVGVPDRKGREEIIQIHTRAMRVEDEFEPSDFADRTQGFVGADLEVLCKEAAMSSIRRIKPEIDFEKEEISQELLDKVIVTVDDFEEALLDVEPSAMREVFVETPEVEYKDIGGLEEVKRNLEETVEWPIKEKEMFEHLNMDESSGILLYGPPGTGKTLLAKAVSNESDSNFISIKGPELLDKYVGESEKGVREVFKKARQNSPSVIFFDEIDSIASERGSGGDTQVTERVVSQLLTELDGVEDTEGVKVIAATNRPDLIDSALLRTGRLDKMVEVGFPDTETREEIFRIHLSDKPVEEGVDMKRLAERTDGYTGSDIAAVCREASMNAMREKVRESEEPVSKEEAEKVVITQEHLDRALEEVSMSISEDEKDKYNQMSERVGRDEIGDVGDDQNRAFR